MLWHREYTRESSHLRVSERPENKQRWIIDEEAAAVVRRIFRMVNDGKGVYQIADILSEEKVLCPSAYLAAKGVGNRRNSKFEDPYRWWGTTVSFEIKNALPLGTVLTFGRDRFGDERTFGHLPCIDL